LEEDSDDGEEDAEEGVEHPLETDEALDLNEKLDSLPFSLPPR